MTDEELKSLVAANAVAIGRLSSEMSEFKDEMKVFKDEMAADMAEFKDEMRAFKDEMAEFKDEMAEFKDYCQTNFGTFGNRLGTVSEIVVVPGIRPVMSKFGHDFDEIISNKVVKNLEGGKGVEVDLFLDNGKEAMAVEIKTRLGTGMVDAHVNRLKKLRHYEKNAGIWGKALYGAIAGIIIDAAVRKYALKNGLYVIEILEDQNRLRAQAPAAGKVRTW